MLMLNEVNEVKCILMTADHLRALNVPMWIVTPTAGRTCSISSPCSPLSACVYLLWLVLRKTLGQTLPQGNQKGMESGSFHQSGHISLL